MSFSNLKFPSGREEPVIIVGTDHNFDWMGFDAQRDRRVLSNRYILFDERERHRFGHAGPPDASGRSFGTQWLSGGSGRIPDRT